MSKYCHRYATDEFVSLQLPLGPTFSLVDMEAHLLWYDGPGLVMRVMSTVSREENIQKISEAKFESCGKLKCDECVLLVSACFLPRRLLNFTSLRLHSMSILVCFASLAQLSSCLMPVFELFSVMASVLRWHCVEV